MNKTNKIKSEIKKEAKITHKAIKKSSKVPKKSKKIIPKKIVIKKVHKAPKKINKSIPGNVYPNLHHKTPTQKKFIVNIPFVHKNHKAALKNSTVKSKGYLTKMSSVAQKFAIARSEIKKLRLSIYKTKKTLNKKFTGKKMTKSINKKMLFSEEYKKKMTKLNKLFNNLEK